MDGANSGRTLTKEDFAAANEVMRRHPQFAAKGSTMLKSLAECHREYGDDRFRLYFGLRQPINEREKLDAAVFSGQITMEEYKQEYEALANRVMDHETLSTFFREMEDTVARYSDVLTRIVELAYPTQHQTDLELDNRVKTLQGKSSLSGAQLTRTLEFLAEIRIIKARDPIEFGSLSGASAAEFVIASIGFLQRAWLACRKDCTAGDVMTAAALFEGQYRDKLPLAQKLLTLLSDEYALARLTLRERAQESREKQGVVAKHVNVVFHSESVALDFSNRKLIALKEKDASEPTPPLLTVEHWSELSIGIDKDYRYFALKPGPDFGAKTAAFSKVELALPGERWRVLFDALAASPDGQTIPSAFLIESLKYFQAPSRTASVRGARIEDIEDGERESLTEHAGRALVTLRNALGDLRRELRKVVDGPSGNHKCCLQMRGDYINAGFRVAALIQDDERNLRFGQPRN